MGGIKQLLVALVLVSCLCKLALGGIIYVGTEGNFLYTCNFNEETGAITLVNSTSAIYPSFIALHPSGQYIYTVNEVDKFENVTNSGGITAYKIDKQSGIFSKINSVPSLGGSPAYIGFDRTYKWLAVANYDSGNYGVWRIQDDFSIAPKPSWFQQDHGSGPKPNQDGPHAHEFVFDYENRLAVIPDLGIDSWVQYRFDGESGSFYPMPEVKAAPGTGPRHIAFHPTRQNAYGVSEIASTVTVFEAPNTLHSSLSIIQVIETLETEVPSAAAEVQFSPEGDMLYVTNRLTNANGTIAIFAIDKFNGKLSHAGYVSTLGVAPRYFTLSKDGRFVLVANQLSNNIRVFSRSTVTGMIGNLVSTLDNVVAPSFILQL